MLIRVNVEWGGIVVAVFVIVVVVFVLVSSHKWLRCKRFPPNQARRGVESYRLCCRCIGSLRHHQLVQALDVY